VDDTRDPVEEQPTEPREGEKPGRAAAALQGLRGLAIDTTPLRESRDFRLLWVGELISTAGRQITVVALPYQVFLLTRSSLAVGLIGAVQVVPLVLVSIGLGSLTDRFDRRNLIVGTEFGLALTTVLLLFGAIHGHPALWYLYAVAAGQAAFQALNSPTRSAAVPNLVSRDQLPAALALNQVMFNTTLIVGPAVAGLILGAFRNPASGLEWAYGADLVTFAASITAAVLLRPMPPQRAEGEALPSGWHAVKQGFAYLRGRRVLISTFLIDLDAMIFGMPRALFPVLALTVFRVGPRGLGLLYAAPAAGALLGAVTAGWVGGIRHQGRAVIWAVILWGAAIAGFGFSGHLFVLALVLLAFAGAADVISAVFRGTILQLSVPDSLRGRLSAVHIMVVTGGPRLGDVEAGVVARLVSPMFSVVTGGLACVAGAALLAFRVPELWRYHAGEDTGPAEG